jgi:hypothetical protein
MVVQVLRLAVVLWLQLYLLAPEMAKLPMLVEHYREHTGSNSALDLSAFLELHYADGSHQDSDHQEHGNLPFHHHHSGAVDHAGCKVLSSAPPDPVQLPIDAVPDITNNQVQVITTTPTLAAQEVEQFVTAPIEQAMASLPGSGGDPLHQPLRAERSSPSCSMRTWMCTSRAQQVDQRLAHCDRYDSWLGKA